MPGRAVCRRGRRRVPSHAGSEIATYGYVSGGVSTPAPSREFITTAQRPVGRRFRRGRVSRSGASATIAVMASDTRSPMSPLTLRPGRMTLAALRDIWAVPCNFVVDPAVRPAVDASAQVVARAAAPGSSNT